MESKELERILNKGWVVQVTRQPLMDSWDVKMAVSLCCLEEDKWMQTAGFCKTLDEALLLCEQMIIRRWDELHPQLEKDIFGYYK